MAIRASAYAVLDYDIFAGGTEARYSAVYCLIVVGEALNNVPAEVRALAPEIEWRAIISMRHVLVHIGGRTMLSYMKPFAAIWRPWLQRSTACCR
jgi:uncharacterized protein with HEPN domain